MPSRIASRGERGSTTATVDADLAAVGLGDAEQHLGDLGAAGADQTEEAKNLARTQIEAHILDEDRSGEMAHAQDRRADDGLLLREEGCRARCRSCSATVCSMRQLRGRTRGDTLARAQNRDFVAPAENLVEEMADEEDRDTLMSSDARRSRGAAPARVRRSPKSARRGRARARRATGLWRSRPIAARRW